MGFFTRLIAGLVAASTLGAGLAGTAGAVDTTGATGDAKDVVKLASDDTSGLPDHLVNGDFEYPGANVLSKNRYDEKASWNWWGVSRKDKMVYDSDHETQWVSLPSTFDSGKFAWNSTEVAGTQNGSSQWHTNEVELQRDSRTGNMYGELCAYQANTSIRQYIRTTPGVLYKVRLKHASLSRDYLDKMQVLIGPAGNEQPVRMTRVGSQNGLDATGESTASTTVSTHASNEMEIKDGQGTPYSSRNHDGQWATYEGVYVATSDVTSFTFKSVDAKAWNLGNLLDDIVFDKAYRLSYDKNASDASGQVPSDETANTVKQAKAKSSGGVRLAADRTDGKVSDLVQRTTTHEDGSVTVRTVDQSTDVVSGCQVYYPAGQRITLATMAKDDDCWDSSMLTRPGHTQLGWNQDRNATAAQPEVTMVEGGMTVYAVWVGNPVLTYDTNKPNTWTGQMPSTPASVSVSYNTAAADGSGWQSGDTSKIRGYRFLGWYAGPQDDAGLYDWNTLLTGNVTVYAHWQRLQANVVYDANGGTGSHANTTGWQYSDVTVPSDTSKSFKRDGYYFKYWNTQKDGKGTTYKDSAQVPLQDKNVTLYAIWAPYHTVITETGGIGLPVLVTGGIVLLVMGIGSTVMLTRRMRGER
ncbi:InlB B-repeat-containing protein [Bifidobacterium pseudocatenulatum]|uniref:InlB B-repeat-containing protein n=1 Tax=Bifidobacterium pseudocatenulatum TaxID=28026 RepID=UPI001898C5F7|nr:InlB B-repeat-containing protein [Bifidobacterium pseudocatenulatum]